MTDHKFKTGDKVYRAIIDTFTKKVVVGEATVQSAGPQQLHLSDAKLTAAFLWRERLGHGEVYATRLEALEALLKECKEQEKSYEEYLEHARKAIMAVIDALHQEVE